MKIIALFYACFIACFSTSSPLSATITSLKFEFAGCNTSEAQQKITDTLRTIDGILSVRVLKSRLTYEVSATWDPKKTFSGASFFRLFIGRDYPLSTLSVSLDADLVNGDKSLLLVSTGDASKFLVDHIQEDEIREESQDLTRFQRCLIEAKILNVREDNFLDVTKCVLY